MKILTTISAVVFLMILTTGLATAKKVPVPTFPFTATGVTSYVIPTGSVFGPYSTDMTIKEIDGLFYGTITWDGIPIVFSAAKDSSGVYNLYGFYSSTVPITGTFTITYVKKTGFELAIQWGFPSYGYSVAGTLSQ